jgi:hypothetical protein
MKNFRYSFGDLIGTIVFSKCCFGLDCLNSPADSIAEIEQFKLLPLL